MNETRLFLKSLMPMIILVVAVGFAPQSVFAQTCSGDLTINLENSTRGFDYWFDGNGPGLPTDPQAGVNGPLVYTVSGPGAWSGLTLWAVAQDGGSPFNSGWPFSSECGEPVAAEAVGIPSLDHLGLGILILMMFALGWRFSRKTPQIDT